MWDNFYQGEPKWLQKNDTIIRKHHEKDGMHHDGHHSHRHRDPIKHAHRSNGPQGSDVALHRLGDEFYAGYHGEQFKSIWIILCFMKIVMLLQTCHKT